MFDPKIGMVSHKKSGGMRLDSQSLIKRDRGELSEERRGEERRGRRDRIVPVNNIEA
jgi:hypothetical protein